MKKILHSLLALAIAVGVSLSTIGCGGETPKKTTPPPAKKDETKKEETKK